MNTKAEPEPSPLVREILADKKLMSRIAWHVSWEICKQIIPWLAFGLVAFWFGSWITFKMLAWQMAKELTR